MMLFKLAQKLYKRIIVNKILIESNIISKKLMMLEGSCIISSPSAWKAFSQRFSVSPSQVIINQSIQIDEIQKTVMIIKEPLIVGIGGGRVLDSAKALAKLGKKKCVLIPTVLSTTAWLNPSASLKHKEKVQHVKGRYDEVLVDPEFIASSPDHLNISGIADILCGYNSMSDWILQRKQKGKNISDAALKLVLDFCDGLSNEFPSYLPVTAASIEYLAHKFIEALGLCWGLRSSWPLEGSEHFLYYALEETYNKPMNHGAIIALNTLLCLKLRVNALTDVKRLQNFYETLGIPYRLTAQGIPLEIYDVSVKAQGKFVETHKLPYSIWNLGVKSYDCIQDLI